MRSQTPFGCENAGSESVDQVPETSALRSLYPQHMLEAARRMDRQDREHDERYAKAS